MVTKNHAYTSRRRPITTTSFITLILLLLINLTSLLPTSTNAQTPNQTITANSSLTFVYSTQFLPINFNWTEGVTVNQTLIITTNITCEADGLSAFAPITVGGSCGLIFDTYLTSTNYTTFNLSVQAPPVFLATQLLWISFTLSGSDASHYLGMYSLGFEVVPQATISLVGFPVNMSTHQLVPITINLSEQPQLGSNFSFNIAARTSDGQQHATPSTIQFTNLTTATFWLNSTLNQADLLNITYSISGPDSIHYIVPTGLTIPITLQGWLNTTGSPSSIGLLGSFNMTTVLTQAPFDLGSVVISCWVTPGASCSPASFTFDSTNWNQPQLLSITAPSNSFVPLGGSQYVPVARRLLGVSQIDPTMLVSLRVSGPNAYQYATYSNTSVTMQSYCYVSNFPPYIYVNSIANAIDVSWIGTTNANIIFNMAVQPFPGYDSYVSPSSQESTGTLAPFSFTIHAPTSIPAGAVNPNVTLSWYLSGQDVTRFGGILPYTSISIPVLPQANMTVAGVPNLLFTYQQSGTITISLTAPVTVGSGGLQVHVILTAAVNGALSTSPALAGTASPAVLTFPEGSSSSSFIYTAPAGACLVLFTFALTGGDAPHYIQSPVNLSPSITIQAPAPILISTAPLEALSAGFYSLTIHPAAAPITSVTISIAVDSGSVSLNQVTFTPADYTVPIVVTITAPTLPPFDPNFPLYSQPQVISFSISGPGSAGYITPIASQTVTIVRYFTSSSSSSTGVSSSSSSTAGTVLSSSSTGAATNGTNSTSSSTAGAAGGGSSSTAGLLVSSSSDNNPFTSYPKGLVILVVFLIAISLILICLILYVCCHRSESKRTLERLQSQSLVDQGLEKAPTGTMDIEVEMTDLGTEGEVVDAEPDPEPEPVKPEPIQQVEPEPLPYVYDPAPQQSQPQQQQFPSSYQYGSSLLVQPQQPSSSPTTSNNTNPVQFHVVDPKPTPSSHASTQSPTTPGPLMSEVPTYIRQNSAVTPGSIAASSSTNSSRTSGGALGNPTSTASTATNPRSPLLSSSSPSTTSPSTADTPSSPSISSSGALRNPTSTTPRMLRNPGGGPVSPSGRPNPFQRQNTAAKSRLQLKSFLYGSMTEQANAWTTNPDGTTQQTQTSINSNTSSEGR